jgi:hypothetical protein
VGLNPSFDENKPEIESNFYPLKQKDNEYQKFFRKFEQISEETRLNWSHLDMLAMRETDQKKVGSLLTNETGKQFIKEQIEVSKEILEQCKPKVIVVANTLARQFLGKTYDEKQDANVLSLWYKFKFNEIIGTDLIINSENLKNVPVFFTSMLSGQRALDKGSYERLVWHIKFALEKLNKI